MNRTFGLAGWCVNLPEAVRSVRSKDHLLYVHWPVRFPTVFTFHLLPLTFLSFFPVLKVSRTTKHLEKYISVGTYNLISNAFNPFVLPTLKRKARDIDDWIIKFYRDRTHAYYAERKNHLLHSTIVLQIVRRTMPFFLLIYMNFGVFCLQITLILK